MATTTVSGTQQLAWSTGTGGAAQHDAPSRRKLGALVALVVCASLAGGVSGAVHNASQKGAEDLRSSIAEGAAAAGRLQALAQVAATSEARATAAEAQAKAAQGQVSELQRKLEVVVDAGFLDEINDAREAERLGIANALGHAASMMPPDEQRRVLAAIVRSARKNGLDPLLLASVIQIESRFDTYATSSVGARGLMQLMPDTANWLSDSKTPLRPTALYDGPLNIELGAAYLRQLLARFDGDLSQALVAYNAGPGVARSLVRHSPAWKRRQLYPRAVLAEYRRLTLLDQVAGEKLAGL